MNNTWMRDMSPVLQDTPFNNILLPGSHNAGSYKINWKVQPALNQGYPHKNLVKWAHKTKFTRNFVNDWYLCQSLDITGQLGLGIRFFHFKIAYANGHFYLSNTFLCERLDTFLHEILTFCNKYPSEIIVLNMEYDYTSNHQMSATYDLELLMNVKQQLHRLLIPRMQSFLSYNDLLPFGNIILFYPTFYTTIDFVWNNQLLTSNETELCMTITDSKYSFEPRDLKIDFFRRLFPFYKRQGRKSRVKLTDMSKKTSVYLLDYPTAQCVTDLLDIQK